MSPFTCSSTLYFWGSNWTLLSSGETFPKNPSSSPCNGSSPTSYYSHLSYLQEVISDCQWMLKPQFSSVQSLSRVWLFVTPWTAAQQASLSITSCWSLLKLMSIESVMPSNHLILCHPLLLLPLIFTSIRVFSNESVLCIRWPKYWSFSFSISPSNEYSGLFSFRMDWLDVLAVQRTLKSLLQHQVQKHQFFGVQLFL